MITPGRLDVGLVGTGKAIPVIARALAGAGHFAWTITEPLPADRERVVSMLRGVSIRPASEVIQAADLVVLCVDDGSLPQLVQSLAGYWKPGQIVMHTSLEHGIGVLEPAANEGVIPLAVSPVIEFTGTSLDLHRMKDAHFAVTATPMALPIAHALTVEMGGEPLVIAEEDRAAFAEATSTVADFSRAIIEQAAFRLSEIGVEHPGVVLRAVAHSAVEEALRRASDGAVDPMTQWLEDELDSRDEDDSRTDDNSHD